MRQIYGEDAEQPMTLAEARRAMPPDSAGYKWQKIIDEINTLNEELGREKLDENLESPWLQAGAVKPKQPNESDYVREIRHRNKSWYNFAWEWQVQYQGRKIASDIVMFKSGAVRAANRAIKQHMKHGGKDNQWEQI